MTDSIQQQYFDENASEWNSAKEDSRTFEIKASYIKKALGYDLRFLDKEKRFYLEVGAGGGLLTKHMRPDQSFVSVVATDISQTMLDLSPELSFVKYIQSDAYDVSIVSPVRTIGLFGNDIIHHLDDPVKAFKEFKLAVLPGSKIVFTEPNAYHPYNRKFIGQEHELRLYMSTPENLMKWMTEAGLTNVRWRYLPIYFPPRWPKFVRYIEKLLCWVLPNKYFSGVILIEGKA